MSIKSMAAGLLLVIGFAISGCGNTLVFAEKSGYDLAININDDPSTPIHVNAGFERMVGAVVPPVDVTQSDQGKAKANGEAVSLFSGFRLIYADAAIANTFTKADLTIRTQFASGMAAQAISSNASMVGKVVDADFERDAAFVEEARQKRVHQLLIGIDQLSDPAAISLAVAPPVHDPAVDKLVVLRDPNNRRSSNAAAARQILKMEVVMNRRDDAALAAWEAAIPATP